MDLRNGVRLFRWSSLIAAKEGARCGEVYTQEGRTVSRSLSFFALMSLLFSPMKSMLVIDGSARLARLFAEVFEKRGWNVSTCGDRRSSMELLAGDELYDAILLSEHVPGATGIQLLSMIRSFDHRRITAVILLAGSDEVIDEALAAGADEVLLRPINPNALVWVVDKLVT